MSNEQEPLLWWEPGLLTYKLIGCLEGCWDFLFGRHKEHHYDDTVHEEVGNLDSLPRNPRRDTAGGGEVGGPPGSRHDWWGADDLTLDDPDIRSPRKEIAGPFHNTVVEVPREVLWEASPHDGPQWKVHVVGEPFRLICVTSQADDEPNARCIVAAVNLMVGVPTEELEEMLRQRMELRRRAYEHYQALNNDSKENEK